MKKRSVAILTVMLLAIALPAALTALPLTDIKFENNTLSYKGEVIEKLYITLGASTIGADSSDIKEILFSPQAGSITVIFKSQIVIISEKDIKGIVIDKKRSYIDIRM